MRCPACDLAAEDLAGFGVDTVIITNGTYRSEIRDQMCALGVDAAISVAAAA